MVKRLAKVIEDREFALEAHKLLTSNGERARMTVGDPDVLDESPEGEDEERGGPPVLQSDTLEPPDIYEWYERRFD